MAEEAKQEETTAQLTPEQQYLQDLLNKFNANPDDLELSKAQRTLLRQVQSVTKELSETLVKADEVAKEIQDRQNTLGGLNQQSLLKRGQSQGLVDALLALRD